MIPPILFRTTPAEIPDESREFWQHAKRLHGMWSLITYQDPLDPDEWPLTAHCWKSCTSGAQFAGLIRLEALLTHGGIYIDQDVEILRPLDPLRHCSAFAAWEDTTTIPDAVLGAEPNHPAIRRCLDLALDRCDQDAWTSGPGVTTEVLPGRDDVLLLPPGAFFPYHYSEKHRRHEDHSAFPWTFAAHHWHGSWVPAEEE